MQCIKRRVGLWLAVCCVVGTWNSATAGDGLPEEPIEIGTTPQFVFDNYVYVIDNHWALKYTRQAVTRVFHQPKNSECRVIRLEFFLKTADLDTFRTADRDEVPRGS